MNKWWAYLHENGTIQVKRFFDEMDLVEAINSPFVHAITRVFEATDREDALKKARGRLPV